MVDRNPILDPARPEGKGEIIKFECDTSDDISLLPKGPKIIGSSAFVLKPAELWKLGSSGWVKVE
jgi:hypothetical protein